MTQCESWLDGVALLDAAISQLTHPPTALRLKLKRNALNPLCCLPDDVLVSIQRWMQVAEYVVLPKFRQLPDSQWPWTTNKTAWIAFTQICHQLREISLSSPILWSNIPMDHPNANWRSLCLSRGANCFLTLDLLSLDSVTKSVLKDIIEVTPRIKALRLAIPSLHMPPSILSGLEDALKQILAKSGSELIFLEIFTRNVFKTPLRVDQFLGGGLVMLTHLILEGIYFENPPPMPRLQRLVVFSMPNDLSCNRIASLLLQTPNLLHLKMGDLHELRSFVDIFDSRTFPAWIPDVTCAVKLPHLLSLSIVCTVTQVVQLLRILPDLTMIHELNIQTTDGSSSYENKEVFVHHLISFSREIYARVDEHLQRASEVEVVGCLILIPDFDQTHMLKFVVAELERRRPDGTLFKGIVEFGGPLTADISAITCRARHIKLRDFRGTLDLMIDISKTAAMQTLDVSEVVLHPDIVVDEYYQTAQDDFERLLEARALAFGVPIQQVNIAYPGSEEVNGVKRRYLPSEATQRVIRSKWKDAGWVTNVEMRLRDPFEESDDELHPRDYSEEADGE